MRDDHSHCWRVGLARFERGADGQSAEIGLLLADAWQSRGLGRFVLNRLTDEARCRAIGVFTGHALWENRRALCLLRRAFPTCAWTARRAIASWSCTSTDAKGREQSERPLIWNLAGSLLRARSAVNRRSTGLTGDRPLTR